MPGPSMIGATWEALLLAGVAALALLPQVFDAGAFKTSLLALVAAGVVIPSLTWRRRPDVAAWFGSGGARLIMAATAIAALGSFSVLSHAAVVDRMLLFVMSMIAAVCGAAAVRRHAGGLSAALLVAGVPTAAVALAQALGWEGRFTPGPEEIVALTGNSTRAGALLALTLPAAVSVTLLAASRRRALAGAGATMLMAAALLLTLARGARLAAALALVILALGVGLALWRRRWPEIHRRAVRFGGPLGLGALVLGAVLAVAIDPGVPAAEKLPDSGSILDGNDATSQVRVALWTSTLGMIEEAPWTGHGLGSFARAFPPHRDAHEAARPGLGGADTTARHPHNELLLAGAEGGWLAAGLLALALAATLGRAAIRLLRTPDVDELTAVGALTAGLVLGQVQDAWTNPATAVPFFLVVGALWVDWLPAGLTRAHRPGWPAAVMAVVLSAALLAMAVPRLRCQLGLVVFSRAAADGVDRAAFDLLVAASDRDPTDVDAQQLVVGIGTDILAAAPAAGPGVTAPVERSTQRLAVLAPHGF